ncbi:MAG: hypothetical protein IKG46_03090 [Solobacterium sp.]|nr:hypothetical protein [Solobacterium sp.]
MATLKKSKKKGKSERAVEMARQAEEERQQLEAQKEEKKKNWNFVLAFEGLAMAVASFVFTYMGIVGFLSLAFNGYNIYRTKPYGGKDYKMAIAGVIVSCLGLIMAFWGWNLIFTKFGLTPVELN